MFSSTEIFLDLQHLRYILATNNFATSNGIDTNPSSEPHLLMFLWWFFENWWT